MEIDESFKENASPVTTKVHGVADGEDVAPRSHEATEIHLLLKLRSKVSRASAMEKLHSLQLLHCNSLMSGSVATNWDPYPLVCDTLKVLAEYASFGDLSSPDGAALNPRTNQRVCMYHLSDDGPLQQLVSADESSEASVGSTLWHLPCTEFEHIWRQLKFDSEIKNELLSYVTSLISLSERGLDTSIVSVNRLIILHGPPGTGKTSLCKALAQMSSILLGDRFSRAALLEVNSHSLFSKWFSESGKLVARLFEQAEEIVTDPQTLLFVLIDEAESLCTSRVRSSAGGDPADSIRAVNALLTQMDKLRRHRNVFVLCTSNLAESLDGALMDRADVTRVVPLPGSKALGTIFEDCLRELDRIDVIKPAPSADELRGAAQAMGAQAAGISARAARKLPAIACAQACKKQLSLDELRSIIVRLAGEKARNHES